MGVAIISGVLASLEAKATLPFPSAKWESHTPGTLTPHEREDESLPSRFIACVSREESVKKLSDVFTAPGALRRNVEVFKSQNVKAAREANVILLWYVYQYHVSW